MLERVNETTRSGKLSPSTSPMLEPLFASALISLTVPAPGYVVLIFTDDGTIAVTKIAVVSMPTIWLPPPETFIVLLGGSFRLIDAGIVFKTAALVVAVLLSGGA